MPSQVGQGIALDRVAEVPEPARDGLLGQKHLRVGPIELLGHLIHEDLGVRGGDEVLGRPGLHEVVAGTGGTWSMSTHGVNHSNFMRWRGGGWRHQTWRPLHGTRLPMSTSHGGVWFGRKASTPPPCLVRWVEAPKFDPPPCLHRTSTRLLHLSC